MMDSNMQFQLVLFSVAVFVCVGWTRLLYYDGLHRQLSRLKRHCLIHAGMIISISGWAVSIGIYVQAASMEVIQQQQDTIQNLATGRINQREQNAGMAQQIAHKVADKSIAVTTPNGTAFSVSLDGRADWTELRRGDSQFGGSSSGIRRGEAWPGIRGDGVAEMPAGVSLHGAIY